MKPEFFRLLEIEPLHNADRVHLPMGFDCCQGCDVKRAVDNLKRIRDEK